MSKLRVLLARTGGVDPLPGPLASRTRACGHARHRSGDRVGADLRAVGLRQIPLDGFLATHTQELAQLETTLAQKLEFAVDRDAEHPRLVLTDGSGSRAPIARPAAT